MKTIIIVLCLLTACGHSGQRAVPSIQSSDNKPSARAVPRIVDQTPEPLVSPSFEPHREAAVPHTSGAEDNLANPESPPQLGANELDPEIALPSLLKTLERQNVRPSWGINLGECFTNQDLQEMISTKRTTKIAESLTESRII
jgi:hypothetical protein